MKITYVGEFMGFPEEEFEIRLPDMNVENIKLFGTYGNEVAISKGFRERIIRNVLNARIVEIETNDKDTIVLGLPWDFRIEFIKGDKKRLSKALRCLFRND